MAWVPAIENEEEHVNNRTILEWFLMAMILGLGIPVAALLGARDGERMASADLPPQESAVAAPDYKAMVLGSSGDDARGREIFRAQCAACHGANADGQGPAAAALVPAPRNFLDPRARWTLSRDPFDIYRTLTEGSPGTAMVGFSASLPVKDRWAVVHYLGTLPGVKNRFTPVDEAVASAWRPQPETR